MKLAQFDTRKLSEEGVDLHVQNLDGEYAYFGSGENKKPFTLKMLGKDSKKYRAENAKVQDWIRSQIAIKSENKDAKALDQDEAAAVDIAMTAALTVGWYLVDDEGKEVPFSEQKAAELYLEHPVIFEQARRFVENRKNFLLSAKKS